MYIKYTVFASIKFDRIIDRILELKFFDDFLDLILVIKNNLRHLV